jgi:eukaryotic-like serine/threonine-protein kinase
MIKVLDFGISKVALPRGKRDLVRTQMALGSPVYMSPEQIRRSDQVDARSDIWAIGCVLFELLTGVTAFDEPSLLELSAAILERDPVPLQTLRPDASEELEQVVLRCLHKNPEERYQNVAELAVALYPFAPRRARISAERCYHMLKNAGIVSTELDLASAYPPAISSGRVTTGALPPVSGRRATGAVPPQIEIAVAVEDDERTRPRKRPTLAIALGLAAAAAGWFAVNAARTTAAPSVATVAPAQAAQQPVDASPTAKVTGKVIDLDQDVPSGVGAAQPSASTQRSANKGSKQPRMRVAPTATGKRPHGEDELDPGF